MDFVLKVMDVVLRELEVDVKKLQAGNTQRLREIYFDRAIIEYLGVGASASDYGYFRIEK